MQLEFKGRLLLFTVPFNLEAVWYEVSKEIREEKRKLALKFSSFLHADRVGGCWACYRGRRSQ